MTWHLETNEKQLCSLIHMHYVFHVQMGGGVLCADFWNDRWEYITHPSYGNDVASLDIGETYYSVFTSSNRYDEFTTKLFVTST